MLVCAGTIFLMSCEDSPEISVSSRNIIIDALDSEVQTVGISANVAWTATIQQDEDWLSIDPSNGSGNGIITLTAGENPVFVERTALIIVSGEGTNTDTIRVAQATGLNIADEIEDDAFRQYCLEQFDLSPKDDKISTTEAKIVTTIVVKNMNIQSLAGIEYFINLISLNSSGNNIEDVDISKNKALKTINCSYNPLKQIDISENLKLTELILFSTEISKIDVSKNTALTWLAVSINQLEVVDVKNNTKLESLECSDNKLTSLDVSNNTRLTTLYCSNNNIKTLDRSKNTELRDLGCSNTLIAKIDLSKNMTLAALLCDSTQITSLNLKQNTELKKLTCNKNKLQSLDLSENKELGELQCNFNNLKTLDVRQHTKLQVLKCSNNQLTDNIDISKNKLLREFDFTENQNLSTIYVWQEFSDITGNYYYKDAAASYEIKN